MKKEILTVFVQTGQAVSVKGHTGGATLLSFSGYAESEHFRGKILPGAVDCQKTGPAGFTLSARYVLEGTDSGGRDCRIFVENNGVLDKNGAIHTRPVVYTDSDCLKWMETTPLVGDVSEENGMLMIHIYEETDRA